MIFFRASSIEHALAIIKNMFTIDFQICFNDNLLLRMLNIIGLDTCDFVILVVSLIVLFVVQLLARKGDVREKLFKQNIVFRWTVLYILIFAVIIFGCYGEGYDATAFIYRRF